MGGVGVGAPTSGCGCHPHPLAALYPTHRFPSLSTYRADWEPAASSGKCMAGVPGVFWRCPAALQGPSTHTGRIGSRKQLAGGVPWGCSGGAQRSYGDHLHPIRLRFAETNAGLCVVGPHKTAGHLQNTPGTPAMHFPLVVAGPQSAL